MPNCIMCRIHFQCICCQLKRPLREFVRVQNSTKVIHNVRIWNTHTVNSMKQSQAVTNCKQEKIIKTSMRVPSALHAAEELTLRGVRYWASRIWTIVLRNGCDVGLQNNISGRSTVSWYLQAMHTSRARCIFQIITHQIQEDDNATWNGMLYPFLPISVHNIFHDLSFNPIVACSATKAMCSRSLTWSTPPVQNLTKSSQHVTSQPLAISVWDSGRNQLFTKCRRFGHPRQALEENYVQLDL